MSPVGASPPPGDVAVPPGGAGRAGRAALIYKHFECAYAYTKSNYFDCQILSINYCVSGPYLRAGWAVLYSILPV